MSTKTKAEVEAEFETFKQTVVKKAMATAKRHNLCHVVQDTLVNIGLADYLPHEFYVEVKEGKGRSWEWADEGTTAKNAVSLAKAYRRDAIADAKREHERPLLDAYEHFSVAITASTDIEGVVTALREKAQKVKEIPVVEIPPFEAPEYPQYRAVERMVTGKIVQVLS